MLATMSTAFSDWLTKQVASNNWTYESLGKRVGVSHVSVGKWLSGKHLPDPKTLVKLAELTGVNVVWLFKLVGYLPKDVDLPKDSQYSAQDLRILMILSRMDAKSKDALITLLDSVGHDPPKTE